MVTSLAVQRKRLPRARAVVIEVKIELVRVLERRMYAAQQMQRRIFLAEGVCTIPMRSKCRSSVSGVMSIIDLGPHLPAEAVVEVQQYF